jgi:hypothetical protein
VYSRRLAVLFSGHVVIVADPPYHLAVLRVEAEIRKWSASAPALVTAESGLPANFAVALRRTAFDPVFVSVDSDYLGDFDVRV